MSDVPPLHQIRTPEGYEGWQWMNGPVFLYDKDDPDDATDARLLIMEWAEVTMKIQRLQLEAKRRTERIQHTEPIIFNFEEAKDAHENAGRIPQTDS